MQLVADAEAESWLAGLQGAREDFDWDAGNIPKLVKHGREETL
jgi:hypothetical protein